MLDYGDLEDELPKGGGVDQIHFVCGQRWVIEWARVVGRSRSHDAVDVETGLKQRLCEIRPVLAGEPGVQCAGHVKILRT